MRAPCESRRAFARGAAACAGQWGVSGSVGLSGLVGVAGFAGWAGPRVSWAQASAGQAPLEAWIGKIKAASASTSFQGTFVVTVEGAASSSRITHLSIGRDRYERVESLDGPPRQIYRHNDLVHTVWPQARLVVVEQRSAVASFPSLPDPNGLVLAGGDLAPGGTSSNLGSSTGIDALYQLDARSDGRVAGREAIVLTITPRDSVRFAHRLWIDRQSSMLLRDDVLGSRGDVLESAAFTDLTVGVRAQPAVVLEGMSPRPTPWRVVKAATHNSTLAKEGWQWDAAATGVAGFRLLSCVRRPMQPAVDESTLPPLALQTTFSDGLAVVSLFAEDFNATRHTREVTQQIGATHTLTRRVHNAWITVVGDVPAATAHNFTSALKRRSS